MNNTKLPFVSRFRDEVYNASMENAYTPTSIHSKRECIRKSTIQNQYVPNTVKKLQFMVELHTPNQATCSTYETIKACKILQQQYLANQ